MWFLPYELWVYVVHVVYIVFTSFLGSSGHIGCGTYVVPVVSSKPLTQEHSAKIAESPSESSDRKIESSEASSNRILLQHNLSKDVFNCEQ